jgi:hypothetical protein
LTTATESDSITNMTNTKAANNNASTVTTIAIVGFGRSGKRLPAGSRSARTFRIELTWDSGVVNMGAESFPAMLAAASYGARMYKAAACVGLV